MVSFSPPSPRASSSRSIRTVSRRFPLGSFSLEWYRAVAADPLVWQGAQNSLLVSVTVGLVSTALGFRAAYTDYRYGFTGKQVYLALALLPPTIPVVILGLAMLA